MRMGWRSTDCIKSWDCKSKYIVSCSCTRSDHRSDLFNGPVSNSVVRDYPDPLRIPIPHLLPITILAMSLASSSSSAVSVIRSAVRSSGATTAKRIVSIRRSHGFCKFNLDLCWVAYTSPFSSHRHPCSNPIPLLLLLEISPHPRVTLPQ